MMLLCNVLAVGPRSHVSDGADILPTSFPPSVPLPEPQQELALLLATGSCSPPLHNFLSSTLGEAGLRRLARGTDAALNSMHTAILERLMPLAELVLFLLGELRGAVLAAGAESWMGLQV